MSDSIADLQARYRASFPEKRAQLLAALSVWREQPASKEALAALHLLLHRLTGSAGAYGFDVLSELARRAEDLLQSHVRDGQPLTEAQIAPIDAAVAAVCDALAFR